MRRKIVTGLGVILILFGVFLMVKPFIEIKKDQEQISESISQWDVEKEKIIKEMDKAPKDEKKNEYPVVNVDGKKIIGKIITKNGEQIPVIEGATETNLAKGATLYENGILPGKEGTAVILGHRETTFGFLKGIKIGDEVIIETVKEKFKFKVDKTYITKPEDPKILEQRKGKNLTLITCYPFGYVGPAPDRFIVNLTLVK